MKERENRREFRKRPAEDLLTMLAPACGSVRDGDHYERCSPTMVTILARGYALAATALTGVQLRGSSGVRSSRLFIRGRRVRMSRR